MISRVTLDTTQLFDGTLSGQKWLPLSIDGLNFPQIVYSSKDKGGADGRILTIGGYGGLNISMEWMIIGSSFSDFVTQRDAFIGLWGTIISDGAKYLKVSRANGKNIQLLIKGVEISGQVDAMSPVSCKMLLTLKTEYPFVVGQTLNSQDVELFNGGGFEIPFAIPFDMSNGGDSEVTITNNGNVYAYPVLRVYGPLTNPTVSNNTLGQTLSISTTIADGKYLEIDTFYRTAILYSGATNYRQYLSGDFIKLTPGENLVRLTGSGDGANTKLVVEFRDHYLNV